MWSAQVKQWLAGGAMRCGLDIRKHHNAYLDAKALIPGPVRSVVDGGAHRGSITAKLLDWFPAATVHAFEPQDDSFAALVARFEGNKRFKANRCALSDHSGEAELHVNKACYSSLLPSLAPEAMEATGRLQKTRLTTLDAWSEEQQVIPELLKLDLQGHELAALRGAAGILEKGVQAVLTEVNFLPRYEGSCLFQDISAYLYGKEFLLFRFYEVWGGLKGNWQQGDALFVRRELIL